DADLAGEGEHARRGGQETPGAEGRQDLDALAVGEVVEEVRRGHRQLHRDPWPERPRPRHARRGAHARRALRPKGPGPRAEGAAVAGERRTSDLAQRCPDLGEHALQPPDNRGIDRPARRTRAERRPRLRFHDTSLRYLVPTIPYLGGPVGGGIHPFWGTRKDWLSGGAYAWRNRL